MDTYESLSNCLTQLPNCICDGYVHSKMSTCKPEFIVPPFFVLQLSENDYTAAHGYGLEIHILRLAPGQF